MPRFSLKQVDECKISTRSKDRFVHKSPVPLPLLQGKFELNSLLVSYLIIYMKKIPLC